MNKIGLRQVFTIAFLLVSIALAPSSAAAQGTYVGRDQDNIGRDQTNIRDNVIIHNHYGSSPKRMERLSGQWVKGDGNLLVETMGSATQCEQACLSESSCKVSEYFRPERKCSLFSYMPQISPGGKADVAIKR